MKSILLFTMVLSLFVGEASSRGEGMKILAKEGVPGLIDEIVSQKENLHKGELSVSTNSGTFTGEFSLKTNNFLVLQRPSESKIVSGPNAGKKLISYHYIPLNEIKTVSFITQE